MNYSNDEAFITIFSSTITVSKLHLKFNEIQNIGGKKKGDLINLEFGGNKDSGNTRTCTQDSDRFFSDRSFNHFKETSTKKRLGLQ